MLQLDPALAPVVSELRALEARSAVLMREDKARFPGIFLPLMGPHPLPAAAAGPRCHPTHPLHPHYIMLRI